MNARDSEKLRGILEEIGYQPSDTEDADLVVYNTCSVRENANLKVYGRLGV
jgi:tRNA-2-methylthio-N6-dimethylallyladenosine synthase